MKQEYQQALRFMAIFLGGAVVLMGIMGLLVQVAYWIQGEVSTWLALAIVVVVMLFGVPLLIVVFTRWFDKEVERK